MQNLVYEWVEFSKIFSNLSQNWLKLFFLKYGKSGDFAQFWHKIGPTGTQMGQSLFLEKLLFVWVYFQIPRWHIPTKTKLEYPPPSTEYTFSMYTFLAVHRNSEINIFYS